jgi:hypothetical protein
MRSLVNPVNASESAQLPVPPSRTSNRVTIFLALVSWSALAFAIANPNLAGLYHDDGIYLVCSKSLATGSGYRIISLPEQPYQTKYPILLPLVLAPVWWLAPDFPANIRWFQVVILAFSVLLLFLAHHLFEKVFKLEPIHRWLVIGLLVLNPALLSASQWILSEIFYCSAPLLRNSVPEAWQLQLSCTLRKPPPLPAVPRMDSLPFSGLAIDPASAGAAPFLRGNTSIERDAIALDETSPQIAGLSKKLTSQFPL